MKTYILTTLFVTGLLMGCAQPPKDTERKITARDLSVTPAVSYSDLFLDSITIEKFISGQKYTDSIGNKLRNFYNSRNYECAWFFKEGIADYAATFYEMYNDYIGYSGDSTLYNSGLQLLYDSIKSGNLKTADSLTIKTELLLTVQFFRYATKAYQGNSQLNTKELDWFIPRKKINPVELLDTMLANKGKNLSALEPVNQQYNLLKEKLIKYYEIEKQGGWPVIKADKKLYKLNDTSNALTVIKKRLFLTGDLSKEDAGTLFTSDLEKAVKSFEGRYGFKQDGIITTALINEMNRPIAERLQQILINMERIRWMPAQPVTDYLLVNIPEFRLHVYEKGNYVFSMNVVTGSVVHSTVIFNGTLKHVVFSPYWNVPPGILKNEVLPGIARNKNYLASHNMEWNAGAVRQKPGPRNSLGLVKFLFPNSYSIYLHDSPAKSLFNEEKRAFSHGCIRVGEPKKLAQYLLRNDAAWDSVKITNAMNTGKEQYVNVKETVPVFIGYFTAWVDRDGKLNFRDDIYGHDKKMKARLFGK
jgi:murein L,D-transpeptidase YcbB/YkuD